MSNNAQTTQAVIVIGGIDAHADTHHVVALETTGKILGDHPFPASSRGYRDALDWLAKFGLIDKIGVESTGSYAAGITRFLLESGVDVVEVNQPHPHLRARRGKDDSIDAEAAARKALSGQATAIPKVTTGVVESIGVLRLARESAVRSRTRTIVQLRSLLVTAPAQLREQLTERSAAVLVARCAGLRPDLDRLDDPLQATKRALRAMARRIQMLDEEINETDASLKAVLSRSGDDAFSRSSNAPVTDAVRLLAMWVRASSATPGPSPAVEFQDLVVLVQVDGAGLIAGRQFQADAPVAVRLVPQIVQELVEGGVAV